MLRVEIFLISDWLAGCEASHYLIVAIEVSQTDREGCNCYQCQNGKVLH